MRIAIDVDEVLSDYLNGLLVFYNKQTGRNLKRDNFSSYHLWEIIGCNQKEELQLLHSFHKSEEFRNIKIIEGAKEAVKILAQSNDLFVITSRPSYLKIATENFIDENFKGLFKGVEFARHHLPHLDGGDREFKKVELCKNLNVDLLIEDSKDYAEECAKQGIPVILLTQPWNQDYKPDNLPIYRANTWQEIVELVEKTRIKN